MDICQEIYMSMMNEIDTIVRQWNDAGIIFEGQFGFASSVNIEHRLDYVFDIIRANGGTEIEETDDNDMISPLSYAIEIDGSWMYFFFNPSTMDLTDACDLAIKYFS